jgi:hypothetical protein
MSFSVITAYNPLGFLAWEIFNGTITARHVIRFLNITLQPFVTNDSNCIIDNAYVHLTEECILSFNEIFQGKYLRCSPYSRDFKPLEKGFANIKSCIKERERERDRGS